MQSTSRISLPTDVDGMENPSTKLTTLGSSPQISPLRGTSTRRNLDSTCSPSNTS